MVLSAVPGMREGHGRSKFGVAQVPSGQTKAPIAGLAEGTRGMNGKTQLQSSHHLPPAVFAINAV